LKIEKYLQKVKVASKHTRLISLENSKLNKDYWKELRFSRTFLNKDNRQCFLLRLKAWMM